MAFLHPDSTNPALDLFLLRLAGEYSFSRRYRAGDVLFREGQPGNTMLLIIQGELGIQKRVKGSDQLRTIAMRGPGDFIGEMAIVEESPRFATVVALSDCELLEFSQVNFERAIKERPALATRVLKSLSQKLRQSDSTRIIELEESNRALASTNTELTTLNFFLDRLIEDSPGAVLIALENGSIYRRNRAARQMFEIFEEPARLMVKDLLPDLVLSRLEHTSEDSRHVEATGVRGDSEFPVLASVSIIEGAGAGNLYLIICQDLTELQALNETTLAVERHEVAQDVVAEVAHDIKNYVAILIGHFELLVSRLTAEQQQRSAGSISTIEATTADIVHFLENAMLADRGEVSYSRVDLVNLLRTLIRFCRSQSVFSQIEFGLEVDPGFPKTVMASSDQIRRIVLNLVINAAEALNSLSRDGDRSIALSLAWNEANAAVRIRIRDNGPGIAAENVAKLFKQRFTTKSSGHGIGLVSVARLVESQGGHISVNSTPGEGTAFEIILPVQLEPHHA